MFKSSLLLLFLSVFVITGCSGEKEKTEIQVQFSEAEYLFNLAAYGKDSTFLAAYNFALANSGTGSEDFLPVFSKKILDIDPEYRLASVYNIFEFRDKINFESTNQDVVKVLNEEIKIAKEFTTQVLKKRIEYACKCASYGSEVKGNAEVLIKVLPQKNVFLFTVNRKLNKDRIINLIQAKSDIGFWETYSLPEIWDYIAGANNAIIDTMKKGRAVSETNFEYSLFRILSPSLTQDGKIKEGDIIGVAKLSDTAQVNKYMALETARNLLPRDLKFMWEAKSEAVDTSMMNLIAVKITSRDRKAPMTGEYIVEAKSIELKGNPVLRMKMNMEGAKILSRFTRENVARNVVLANNNVVFCNLYLSVAIEGGELEISGNFTLAEADKMAALLSGGPMPAFGIEVISVN
jgi:SecD/SecF fusion protein